MTRPTVHKIKKDGVYTYDVVVFEGWDEIPEQDSKHQDLESALRRVRELCHEAMAVENYYTIYRPLIDSVTESSAETLNASGETVRPAPEQARLDEAGRQALMRTRDNCPSLGKSFRTA